MARYDFDEESESDKLALDHAAEVAAENPAVAWNWLEKMEKELGIEFKDESEADAGPTEPNQVGEEA